MRKYELTLVLDGKATPAKISSLTDKLLKLIELLKGKITKTEDWGRKTAAGYYLFYELELEAKVVKALTDKLRVEEGIIKYLLLRKEK